MVHVPRRLVQVFITSDISFVEGLLAILYYIWSVLLWFLQPDLFSTQPVYAPLAAFADQHLWALAFFITATIKSYGVLFEIPIARIVGAMCATFIWLFIAWAFTQYGRIPASTWGYFVFAIICIRTAVSQAWALKLQMEAKRIERTIQG